MRFKQIRQHEQRSQKQVYEIWSNQIRKKRPNLIDKISAKKSIEIPSVSHLNENWGVAQPR